MRYSIILLSLLFVACGKDARESDLQASSLYGPVSKLKESTYSAVKEADGWKKLVLQTVDDYAYNKAGFVNYSMYSVPNYFYSETYIYDEEGRPVRFQEVRGRDTSQAKSELLLDDNGNIIREQWVDPEGRASAVYVNRFENNRMVETRKLNDRDELMSVLLYHYDVQGNQDTVQILNQTEQLEQYTVKTFKNKWLEEAKTYKLVEDQTVLLYSKRYEYDNLDKEGNWTIAYVEHINYEKKDTVLNIVERIVQYY